MVRTLKPITLQNHEQSHGPHQNRSISSGFCLFLHQFEDLFYSKPLTRFRPVFLGR